MADAYRRRLLGTTLPVAMDRPLALNTSAVPTKPPPTGAEIMDACKKLMAEAMPGSIRPRWVGGGMPGIRIEIDPSMPDGWFGLRQPDDARPYAGPLPITSFGIFYRGGDVVRLSPKNAAQLSSHPDTLTKAGGPTDA